MTNELPLVSVGVPLYNAEDRVQHILDTLRSQTCVNLEIIISDNASTDRTWEICRQNADRDERIRVFRNETNRGAIKNFHQVFYRSSGKYFLWVAQDDDRESDYISACVKELEIHPEAVLAYTDQRFINAQSGEEGVLEYELNVDKSAFWCRAKELLTYKPTPYSLIYGVYRREALIPYIPMPRSPFFDIHFLLQVSQEGTFVHIPRILFTKNVTIKEFHRRMRSINPQFAALPVFLVHLVMFVYLLRFAWSIDDGIEAKLRVSLASASYSVPRIVTHIIPVSVRNWLRKITSHNSTLAKILEPLLSVKQLMD
jgi:glycosyltransferase involved in cell wall biosynthesis